MKLRKVTVVLSALMLAFSLAGCGGNAAPAPKAEEAAPVAEAPAPAPEASEEESVEEPVEEPAEESTELSSEEKVKLASDLIDAIYVQEWTPDTEQQCKDAKEAWDALSDEEKEMVEGEDADPDYFGRDTGDASKDDPLNSDGIGENEILVVSFGTSFNDSRTEAIGGIEKAIAAAYPDWSVRRAFTAQIIINHIMARDGEKIDNVEQALKRAEDNGVKNLLVQPTHLMHGAEYDELMEALSAHEGNFEKIVVSEPLLGEPSDDISVINEDKTKVAEYLTAEAVKEAGFESAADAAKDGTAFVFMGHGTSHTAHVAYDQMKTVMGKLKYDNVFVGTVEGEPEDTEVNIVLNDVKEAGYKKVVLRPLMVVGGDHANNDMAGDDEDSWKSIFNASGAFDSVDCQVSGMGAIKEIQEIYVEHIKDAMDKENFSETTAKAGAAAPALNDGEYEASFTTDSSMFHVNEALDDKGKLTVKDGKMVIHISLASKNIVNLFPGLAKDAESSPDKVLQPTVDKVDYKDGTSEEVFGFDVPVPELDKEFDLALLGKKGKWYDHKVKVTV